MDKLLIIDDEGVRRSVELEGDHVTIGRLASNTVRLEGENVSRRHARMVRTAPAEGATDATRAWQLEDLASYNGVTLNDAPLEAPRKLAHGDRFVIGDNVLVLVASGQPEPSAIPRHRRDGEDDEERGDADNTADDAAGFDEPPPPRRVSGPPPSASATGDAEALPAFQMKGSTAELLAAAARGAIPPEIRHTRLVFLEPADAPPPVRLDRLPLVIGSGEGADIRLAFESIAPEHARLRLREGQLWIEPIDREKGAVDVGDEPVTEVGRALAVGDAIRLGEVTARVARRHRIAPTPPPRDDDEGRGLSRARTISLPARREPSVGRTAALGVIAVVVLCAVVIALWRNGGQDAAQAGANTHATPPPPPPTPEATDAAVAATDAAAADAAPELSPEDTVAAARQAFEDLDFERAVALLAPLDAREDLAPAVAREASLIETGCLIATGETERATAACARAVRLGFDPEHATDQPPRVRAACRAAAHPGDGAAPSRD